MIAFLCGSSGIYFPYYVTKIGYVYKACLEGFHMEIKRFMKFLPLEENNVIRKHAYDDVSSVLLNASTLSDNTDTTVAQKRIDTSQCGKTLGCLRVPSGCNDNTDCKFLLTFAKKATYIDFSVSGKSNGWVAVGFNDQPKMVSKVLLTSASFHIICLDLSSVSVDLKLREITRCIMWVMTLRRPGKK